MAGITDAPVRRMATRFGAGLVVSEMIASDWLANGDPSAFVRAEGDGISLHVVQLAGCEARWFSEGARIAESAGAHIIDINMGCPAKSVTSGEAGAALLRDIDHAETLIKSVVEAVSVPVTLKMRLGWDEGSIVAPDLAQRAEGLGVAMVTVHGRTRQQFYKGWANWNAIAEVKAAVNIPVVANGDLITYEDAAAMRLASGADAVMIGRGAQGKPWFPGQVGKFLETGARIEDPEISIQRDVLLELYDAWLSLYGIKRGVREARKHIGWALHAAAQTSALPDAWIKHWRSGLLMEAEPSVVIEKIRSAFEDAEWKVAA